MVRNTLHFVLIRLCGGNLHAGVYLHGIGGDYFAVKYFGKLNRKAGFARGGRPHNGDDFLFFGQFITPCQTVFQSHFFS